MSPSVIVSEKMVNHSSILKLFFWMSLGLGSFVFSAQASCINPEVKTKDESSKVASHFVDVTELSKKQKQLLDSFLKKNASQEDWKNFALEHNDWAATFVSLTTVLAKTELFVGPSESISALDMIDQLEAIRGVRVIAKIDLAGFKKWVDAGGRYEILHRESGSVSFASHWQKGGGLHCGFDTQGYTRYDRPPYIHWNVNLTSGSSDIHLDGKTPWIWGFIPNPIHLTYSNSDVRQWWGVFDHKYGSPGFLVEDRK